MKGVTLSGAGPQRPKSLRSNKLGAVCCTGRRLRY